MHYTKLQLFKNLWAQKESVRFIINGLIATLIHFLILYMCVNLLVISYDGISNFIGAIFGTIYSFLGNKFFVFKSKNNSIFREGFRFLILYSLMALNHGIFLYIWSDLIGKDFIIGFFIITILNTFLSFFYNKRKVFI